MILFKLVNSYPSVTLGLTLDHPSLFLFFQNANNSIPIIQIVTQITKYKALSCV